MILTINVIIRDDMLAALALVLGFRVKNKIVKDDNDINNNNIINITQDIIQDITLTPHGWSNLPGGIITNILPIISLYHY